MRLYCVCLRALYHYLIFPLYLSLFIYSEMNAWPECKLRYLLFSSFFFHHRGVTIFYMINQNRKSYSPVRFPPPTYSLNQYNARVYLTHIILFLFYLLLLFSFHTAFPQTSSIQTLVIHSLPCRTGLPSSYSSSSWLSSHAPPTHIRVLHPATSWICYSPTHPHPAPRLRYTVLIIVVDKT